MNDFVSPHGDIMFGGLCLLWLFIVIIVDAGVLFLRVTLESLGTARNVTKCATTATTNKVIGYFIQKKQIGRAKK